MAIWIRTVIVFVVAGAAFNPARAEKFTLLTGVDPGLYPGANRTVFIVPGPGFPGTFNDGDRLAGTLDAGPAVAYQGIGAPMYTPNQFGSLSFLFRRGSAPLGPPGQIPFLGIEFLGGPLLDLDGDLNNGSRSLTPVMGQTPVEIPGSESFLELEFDFGAAIVTLNDVDVSGNNEGGPGAGPEIATIVVTIAGTQPDGAKTGPVNPGIDTRTGTLTSYTGTSGTLTGVYHIGDLGYEIWEDTILNSASTGPFLGTLQYLGRFNGWLIERDGAGQFPLLAGEGLGGALWPLVDISAAGQVFNAAHGAPTATIATGIGGDTFTAPGNGGVALTDFGGDLGAYFDAVVIPLAPAGADRVVYLESAGFGINNSFDPVFGDTIGYDVVLIATGGGCGGLTPCDTNCDGVVTPGDIAPFVLGLTQGQAAYEAAFPACSYLCANDVNGDGLVSPGDIAGFVQCLIGG